MEMLIRAIAGLVVCVGLPWLVVWACLRASG